MTISRLMQDDCKENSKEVNVSIISLLFSKTLFSPHFSDTDCLGLILNNIFTKHSYDEFNISMQQNMSVNCSGG